MPTRGERVLDQAIFVVLFAASVVLNAVSAFLVPKYVAGHLGIALVIALVGNVVLCGLGAWGTRRVAGVTAGALGWLVAFAVITFFHPGGDVILAGTLQGDHGVVVVSTLWVVAGLVGCGAALATAMVVLASPRRRPLAVPETSSEAGTTPSG